MTRRLAAAALAALAALTLLAPGVATAAAGPADPAQECEFGSLTHPLATDRQVGYLGGAVVAVNDGSDLRTGRVTCALRKGETHADPVLASVTSLTTPGVVTVPRTPVEYVLRDDEPLTVCLSVEIDGAGTYYWDAVAEAWSASPLVICHDWFDEPFEPIGEAVEDLVDPVVCAALGDDDLYVADTWVWDCPPYGSR